MFDNIHRGLLSPWLSGGALELGPGALEVGTYTKHNKITIPVSFLVDAYNDFDGARNHRIQGAVRRDGMNVWRIRTGCNDSMIASWAGHNDTAMRTFAYRDTPVT